MSGTLWNGREKTSTSQQTARKDDEGRKRTRKIFSDWVLLQYITNKVINCGWTFMPRKCFTNLITRKQTRRKLQNANHFEACHSLYSTWSEWHECHSSEHKLKQDWLWPLRSKTFSKRPKEESKQRVTIPPVKVITILMKLVKKETLACNDKFKFPSLHGLLIWVFAHNHHGSAGGGGGA